MLQKLTPLIFVVCLPILFWLFPDPIGKGYFSSHYFLFISFLIIVAIFSYIVWLLVDKHRTITVIILILLSFGSALVGSQLSAPKYYIEDFTVKQRENPISNAKIIKRSGVIFSIKGCDGTDSVVRCTVIVKSTDKDREINFKRNTRLIDEKGNIDKVENYIIGQNNYNSYSEIPFVGNMRTELVIEFVGMPSKSSFANLLQIHARYSGTNNEVSFRRIPIER